MVSFELQLTIFVMKSAHTHIRDLGFLYSYVPNCRGGGGREGGEEQIANFEKKPLSSFNYYKRIN